MQRRTLLKLGLAGGVVLAAVGAGVTLFQPVWHGGRLLPAGQSIFRAVAIAVLDGSLPDQAEPRNAALNAHMHRIETTLRGLPPYMQKEVADLTALLATPMGRISLATLATPWDEADVSQVQASMQSMRISKLAIRQQIYHALRDLTHAAYFSDASTWGLMRYPGPGAI